jgi:hypothetical protein
MIALVWVALQIRGSNRDALMIMQFMATRPGANLGMKQPLTTSLTNMSSLLEEPSRLRKFR